MENKMLKHVVENVGKVVGLLDPTTEDVQIEPDRIGVGGTTGTTSVDQSVVTAAEFGSTQVEIFPASHDIPGSLTQTGEKFYLIQTADWASTHTRFQLLLDLDPFRELMQNYMGSYISAKYYRWMKAGLEIIVQCGVQQFQSGCLAVALVPGDKDGVSYAGLGCGPHGYINAAINNCIRILVPYVSCRAYYRTSTPVGSVWRLMVVVYNPLRSSASGTSYAHVTVLARFSDLEVHGMMPSTQMYRNPAVRIGANLNVVNMSGPESDWLDLSLCGERCLPYPSGGGGTRITDFSTWTKIPGLMGYFTVGGGDAVTKRLAVWPVNPVYNCVYESPNEQHTTPLASIAQQFCFWRGDITYHLQVVGTRFHHCRLLIVYYPGSEADINWIKDTGMRTASAGCCAVFDINGIASTCVFRVPFVSDTHYRVIKGTKQHTSYSKMYESTGHVMVYLMSKLVYPTSAPSSVEVNVFISAEDLELYVPTCDIVGTSNKNANGLLPYYSNPVTNAGDDDRFASEGTVQQVQLGKEVIVNEPQDDVIKGAVTAIEDPELEKLKPLTFPQAAPGVTRHTKSHMNIYNFMRKPHVFCTWTFRADSSQQQVVTIPIDLQRRANQGNRKGMGGVLQWFFSLFHLYRGPLEVIICFGGSANVDGAVWFTPAGKLVTSEWNHGGQISLGADYALGFTGVRFNSKQTNNLRLRLPFYSCMEYVSGCCPENSQESVFGNLTIALSNYGSNDQTFSVVVYLALTEDSECYFPRPPLRNSLIYSSLATATVLEEIDSLDYQGPQPQDEISEGPPAEASSLNQPCTIEGQFSRNIYRSLRMRVGAVRLKYAKEELQKTDLVTQAGELFPDNMLVQIRKNGILYRGFAYKGKIFTTSDVTRVTTSVPVLKNARFVLVDQHPDWLSLNVSLEEEKVKAWLGVFKESLKFNWSAFMSENFENAFAKEDLAYLRVSLGQHFEAIMKVFQGKSLGMLDRTIQDSEIVSELTEVGGMVKNVAEECHTLMEDVRKAVQSMAEVFPVKRQRFVMRLVTCLVKTGLRLYMAWHSEWDPKILVSLSAEMGLDFVDCALDVGDMLRGLLMGFAELIKERDVVTTQGVNWRDVSCALNIFKSAKSCVCWVVEHVQKWYDGKYGERRKRAKILLDNEQQVHNLLGLVDEFVTQQVTSQQHYNEGVEIVRQLRTLQSLLWDMEGCKPYIQDVREAIRSVHLKLRGMSVQYDDAVFRHEPTVLYCYGEKGTGKSLLAMAIATKLCIAHGIDPKDGIYTKSFGVEFWDGYHGQLVCIFDDIGQTTDDEDWTTFCQLVSSCPYRLNMAAVEAKGQHFVSPYIICTSNLISPDPRTIYHTSAVLRRLTIKVSVELRDYYKRSVNGQDVLNLALARQSGAIGDLSCLLIKMDGREVSMNDLVVRMKLETGNRVDHMNEFIELWSQSEGPTLCDVFTNRAVSPSNRLLPLFDTLRNHKWWILGGVVGMLATAGTMYGLFKMIQPRTQGVYQAVPKVRRTVNLDDKLETQSLVDKSLVIETNLVKFGVGNDPEKIRWTLNAFGLYDNWMVVPAHALKFSDVSYVFIYRNGTVYACSKQRAVIIQHETNSDLLFINIPGIPKFRDVRCHFVKESDVAACDGILASLCTYNNGVFQIISEGCVKFRDTISYRHTHDNGKVSNMFVERVWKGVGESSPGSCGGILVSANRELGVPFIGVHCAAGGGTLVAAVLTQEDIKQLEGVLNTNSRVIACNVSTKRAHTASVTKYIKTELHGVLDLPVTKAPSAQLYNKVSEFDVASVVFSKFVQPRMNEPYLFDASRMAVLHRFEKVLGFLAPHTLTVQEAIEGIIGLEGIDMNTGPGIPYIFHNLTKKDLWNGTMHPLLKSRVSDAQNCLVFGFSVDAIFQTCCKDELRPVEKVRAGKTRLIDVSPFHLTIVTRQFVGAVVARLHGKVGWNTGLAIGIDPDSEWTALYQDIKTFGDVGVDLDFASFDASVQDWMIAQAFQLMGDYGHISPDIIRGLVATFTTTRRQLGNLLYTVQGSLPSGMACTSVVNSLINTMCLNFALSRVLKVPHEEVDAYVKTCVYGDDVIMVARRGLDVSVWFLRSLQRELANLGFTVTAADKGELKAVPVEKLQFLKRGQRWCSDGHVHPTIDITTIDSLLQWRTRKACLRDNILDALWFLFHHGQKKYIEYREMLMMKLREIDFDMRLPTYEEQRLRFVAGLSYRDMLN